MLTDKSRIKEVYKHPVGRDIINKILLQMNISDRMIKNPVVGNLRICQVARLTKKVLGESFFETFLNLLNIEKDIPDETPCEIEKKWWKEGVFYQIYPVSFQDSNGDGIGDLQGILSRLDYLKDLGVDCLWLSPIYASPYDDNGYDISDYRSILDRFGTMEDYDALLKGVHERGMRLIMDLVVNHTSDEHPWFVEALKDKNSKYRDYYFFEQSKKGEQGEKLPPNNWNSFFSGSAWNYYEQLDEWGLHLFSKKQMDLNWENQEVREEVASLVRFWMDKGVDGFRLDVINYISKNQGLPMGDEKIGELMGFYGIEHYFYGPRLHEYLKELVQKAFAPYNAFSVGETPGVGMEMSKLLTADYRRELDMIFSFDHLETPGHVRFDDYEYDLNYLKQYMMQWQTGYGNHCWMSLFFENHDNPRFVSKINPDPAYRQVIAKLLATMQLTLRGTPFIFQGQEIGSINKDFQSMEALRDVESINLYEELLKDTRKPMTEKQAFAKILAGSRDHARTPMQWDGTNNGGFTKGAPWINGDDDYKTSNVAQQLLEENSVLNYYQKLIAFRKNHKTLVYGDIIFVNHKKKNIFCYYRKSEEETFYVEINLTKNVQNSHRKAVVKERIFSNYEENSRLLLPYQVNVYSC